MKPFKFDHTKKNVLEACGISEYEADNMKQRLSDTVNGKQNSSEAIEALCIEFSKDELAFLLTGALHAGASLIERKHSDPLELLAALMSASKRR